jgi:hypothetical protein
MRLAIATKEAARPSSSLFFAVLPGFAPIGQHRLRQVELCPLQKKVSSKFETFFYLCGLLQVLSFGAPIGGL